MKFKFAVSILVASFLHPFVFGQPETYTINKTSFSSEKYDEFSPVYYKNGFVFCSNRTSNKLLNYSTGENKGLFKISYIDTVGMVEWQNTVLFSKNLKTKFNDGPVTFSSDGDTIYFSRNLEVDGKLSNLSSVRNKLGIFYAVLEDGKWTKVREFRINNEWYNVTTPWISPDGKKMFFASDMPGGFGGSDLYYSLWEDNYWNDPVNLGPVINTEGNEAYPFVNPSGNLLFSSDGLPGFGGKDIFFSRSADTAWLTPVHLDAPINSPFDDFGIITDNLMDEGYFSSNRDKSLDIFHFRTNTPQIFYNSIQRENQYCFKFNNIGSIFVDTTLLQYKWSFGDGESAGGVDVSHCYQGPGNYKVQLDIVERGTGILFFTKQINNIELRDFEQPFINSPNVVVKGDLVDFDGLKSTLPGYKILSYSWDFGDKNRSSGEIVNHSFKEKGEYFVNLELVLQANSNGNVLKRGVSKKIIVLNDIQEKGAYLATMTSLEASLPDITKYKNALINVQYSAETEFQRDAVFIVEFLSSKTKVGISSNVFSYVPKKYTIKELYDADSKTYRYIVDQQMSLMSTYPAFREMVALGFKEVQIKIFVLKSAAEKELHNLIKINGAYADTYFDSSNRLTSNAYIMLDQIVKLMNKYPGLRLEVAVHSDSTGPAGRSLELSQLRSQLLVDYITNRGISVQRLVATGFGGSKPIAPNFLEKDRKLNRRIDFIIIN